MPTLQSPRSQAGIMSFYDAPTKGPKFNPRLLIAVVIVIAFALLIVDHFIYI